MATATKTEGEQKVAVKKSEEFDEDMEEELAGFQHEQCFGEAVNYIWKVTNCLKVI